MGGRGSSSGMSDSGKKYGTEYRTILQSGNIKFIKKNRRQSETLMETMTKGRVYVTVGGDELLNITYFDKENKRSKEINLNHTHKGIKPHTHNGYFHNENNGAKGASRLTTKEKSMVDRVNKIWYNYLNK